MTKKKCFVISPISDEGSEIREHADNVYDYVIKPAMEECGIESYRSDHLTKTGKISEEMFSSLLGDDLCIALLTYHNPNVFYELAVAQAANRPVILMIEKGSELPFDIKDLRYLPYDLKPRSLMEKGYVKTLVDYIKHIEESGWIGERIFGDCSPLGENPVVDEHYKFYCKSDDFGSSTDWIRQLEETTNVFDLMGISLGFWRKGAELIIKKAAEGCKIKILLLHPDNDCFPHFLNSEIFIDQEKVKRNSEDMFQFFSKLADSDKDGNIEVRRIRNGCPHFQITRTDDKILYTPYLFSRNTGASPMWLATNASPLYHTLLEEFESLWIANSDK